MKKFTFLLIISMLPALVLFISCEDSPVELPLTGCISGWSDCNDDMSDGCETDTSSDNDNCGNCDIVCAGDTICVDGDCVVVSTCIDGDKDGYGEGCDLGSDCDDTRSGVNYGADEVCDGMDNDCDEQIDEGFDFSFDEDHCGGCFRSCSGDETCIDGECVKICIDQDEDGFMDPDQSQAGCSMNVDCDDTDKDRNPDAIEVCDGIDNDCNGVTDDGLTYSDTPPDNTSAICSDGYWQFVCKSGFSDANSDMSDGCESSIP